MKTILLICLALATVVSVGDYARASSTGITYTYDDLNRLGKVLYADGSYVEYQYDEVGNFTTVTSVSFVQDSDGDGVIDLRDNCPSVANTNQSDVNNNGIGDACDTGSDTDHDGLSDADEVLIYHSSPNNSDTDNDGVGDGQEVINGTDPVVSDNASFNPDGEFHCGVFLDPSVAEGGNQMTLRQVLNFNGSVVGSYEVVAASAGAIGQTGEVRIMPNPDHTFRVVGTDYTGITANDQSFEVLGDVVKGNDALSLQINGKKGIGMSEGSLNGDYVFTALHDTSVSQAATMVARQLALSFNGNGGVAYTSLADSAGGSGDGNAVYSVLGDGTLNLLGGTGFVTPDGEVVVVVDTTVDADPQVDDEIFLGIGVRQGSGLSEADLVGEFIYYEMGYELHTWTSRVRYRFNGHGSGSYYVTGDSDGQTSHARSNFTYTVDPTGNVAIVGSPVGVMSANGEYLIFADLDPADASPGISMGIGVKTSQVARDHIGAYNQGNWYLDINENGDWEPGADFQSTFGAANMKPLAGDWNGDGYTEFGAYVDGSWYLDMNGNGVWDGPATDRFVTNFGGATDLPVVGDWNGDGISEIGVYLPNNNVWHLDYNGSFTFDPAVDIAKAFGFAGCIPVVGDWNGSGRDKIGVYNNGQWYLDTNGNFAWSGIPNDSLLGSFGAGMLPVAGDWSGNGIDRIGTYLNGYWYLDIDGNGRWNPTLDKQMGSFGSPGMLPMVGKW